MFLLDSKLEGDRRNEKNFHNPGVYFITGGRQVGKTTFLKQFILHLLEKKKIRPDNILFLTGELLDTHHLLRRTLEQFLNTSSFQYLFIDEINYIPNWDKTIKYLADIGLFEKASIILTDSDSRIIKTAMKRFAGRRGMSDKVDFDFCPLSFREFVCLKINKLKPLCRTIIETPLKEKIPLYEKEHNKLMTLFSEYLLHGGYLPAISAFAIEKTIPQGLFNTYIHWIIGDILKFNKSEHYLFEILRGITTTYNSQISWNSLGKKLSIEHHKTVADYCQTLEDMHVLHIQQAFLEHKRTGAPKKNRKIYFRDPFIHHTVENYLNPKNTMQAIQKQLNNNAFVSAYVEAIVVDHCKRWAPTYYIKGNKGEVDIALIQENTFFPIEIKWSEHIRSTEIKQIQTYANGIILTPHKENKNIGNNTAIPLIRFLIHIDNHCLVV